jgi:hypothetical protein
MEFWASSEVFQPASAGSEAARLRVEPFLNAAFAGSSLSELNCELRYVPIMMPAGMRERYPSRSRREKGQPIYNCCPHLDYLVFVGGTLEAQLREYIRGIATSAPFLPDLGASPQQVQDFNSILESAVDRLMVERLDQKRRP